MGSEKEGSRPGGRSEREVRPCPMLSAKEESGRFPEVTKTPPRPVEGSGWEDTLVAYTEVLGSGSGLRLTWAMCPWTNSLPALILGFPSVT